LAKNWQNFDSTVLSSDQTFAATAKQDFITTPQPSGKQNVTLVDQFAPAWP